MGARKRHNNILLAVLGFAVVLVVVIVVAFYPVSQEPEGIHGQVEVSEYHVMGQVPGRILEIRVSEGDYVKVGDTLIIIDAPESPAHGGRTGFALGRLQPDPAQRPGRCGPPAG